MLSRKNIQLFQLLSVGFCNRSIQHMDMVSYSGRLLEALIFGVRTRFLAWNQSIESQMILISNKYKERTSTALNLQRSKMFDDLPAARLLDLASLHSAGFGVFTITCFHAKHSAPLLDASHLGDCSCDGKQQIKLAPPSMVFQSSYSKHRKTSWTPGIVMTFPHAWRNDKIRESCGESAGRRPATTSPIKLKQPGEATSQAAPSRDSPNFRLTVWLCGPFCCTT